MCSSNQLQVQFCEYNQLQEEIIELKDQASPWFVSTNSEYKWSQWELWVLRASQGKAVVCTHKLDKKSDPTIRSVSWLQDWCGSLRWSPSKNVTLEAYLCFSNRYGIRHALSTNLSDLVSSAVDGILCFVFKKIKLKNGETNCKAVGMLRSC